MANGEKYVRVPYKAMNELLDQLVQAEDKLTAMLAAESACNELTFARAARALRCGQGNCIHVGDRVMAILNDGTRVPYIVIGKDADQLVVDDGRPSITVRSERALGYGPFALPDKAHPWGWNSWPASYAREVWLETEVLGKFDSATLDAIALVRKKTMVDGTMQATDETMFLLAASEVGFAVDGAVVFDEGDPYEFYGYCSSSYNAEEPQRQLLDSDGDKAPWWLRSPYPSTASSVRRIRPDGSLGSHDANSGYALAPACVIA